MFSKDIYISRRKKLVSNFKKGVLLFLGNDESPMNYFDNPFPYRQDSTFLYYFGLDFAGLNAIIDVEEGREIIFGDELTIDDIVWMGPQQKLKYRAEQVGISEVKPASKIVNYLKKAISAGREIHYIPYYRAEHSIRILEWLGIPFAHQAQKASVKLIKAVVDQRNHKSQEEIEQIENAVDISAEMHIKMMQMVRPGMMEAEVAAAVTEIALKHDGYLSFPVIATKNSQTLHNHYLGNILQEGDLFLLDAGAENKMHYSGDLSSTIPVSKHYSERQKIIYEIALKSHFAAVDALKPGVSFKDVYYCSCAAIMEGLKDIGLVKGDPVEAAHAGAHAIFFPCGLGHMMGLDVHDMENLGEVWVGYNGEPKSTQFGLKSLRLARKLEPGFVITIEPGIYFIPELIDMWKSEKRFEQYLNYNEIEKFKDFSGLRNEEDYLITADGKRRLGKYVPMTVEEVEALR